MSSTLVTDSSGTAVQVFTLTQGKCNLVSPNTTANPSLVHCVEDGSVVLTWSDETETTIAMTAGDKFGLRGVTLATVSSGKFHFC